MHYGSLQGEPAAGCFVAGSTLGATIVGEAFNVASVTRISAGVYELVTKEGCPTGSSIVVSNPVGTTPGRSFMGAGAGDTDFLKHVEQRDSVGAPIDGDFYFVLIRSASEE